MENYGVEYPALPKARKLALDFYCREPEVYGPGARSLAWAAEGLADLKAAVLGAEAAAVEAANRKLAELREEHAAYTKAWVKATDNMQAVLKQEIDRLEAGVREWEPRAAPLSERFKALYAAEDQRRQEREELLAEWPALEGREKGEALRRLFEKVTLRWERRFHPASPKPTRPRKTNRPGRYSYTLQRDAVEWSYAGSDLASSS